MQYTNYAMKNNVFGTLSAPISSLATTIQLNTGQGARFTTDMLATLESIEGNKVTKREIVKITNVSGDTLTVIRKFAPCPSSDDANTQGQVSYSFSADDTISVYISKEHFDKIDNSLNDIYDNGVNKLRTEVVSGLQIKVNPGTVLVGNSYYEFAGDTITLTDNATNYVEIDEDGDLVANTSAWGDKNTKIAKVTTSSGAVTSIEDRRLGTVGGKIGGIEIHELTEKEVLSPDDEFVIADSENIYQNKKVSFKNFGCGLSYKDSILAGENLSKGDIILNTIPCYSGNLVENSQDFGDTNTKIAIKQIASGTSSTSLDLYLKATNSSTATGLSVSIESDNNGKPSGTALVTKDIIDDFKILDLSGTITGSNVGAGNIKYYVVGFSNDGKTLICTDENNSDVYKYTLTTPFDVTTATETQINYNYYLSRYAILVNDEYIIDKGTLHHFENFDVDTLTSVATNTPIMSKPTMIADGLSRDGRYRYIISAENTSEWNRYLDYYELSTPYDITTTGNKLGSIQMYNSSWSFLYGKMSVGNGFVGIQTPASYAFYKLVNGIPNGETNSTSVGSNNYGKAVDYSGTHFYYNANNYLYLYNLGPTVLNTELKKYNVDFSSAPSLNKGDIFWITLTPSGGSGDRFSLGYIELDTEDYNLAVYDGNNWTDDTMKYPYAYTNLNNGKFYLKGSLNNVGDGSETAKVINSNITALSPVSYDFDGISRNLSNLILGEKYYLSTTDGKLSTTSSSVKVGIARSSTDLQLKQR